MAQMAVREGCHPRNASRKRRETSPLSYILPKSFSNSQPFRGRGRRLEWERIHPRRIFLDFLSVLRRIRRPTATGTLSRTTRVYVKYAGLCVRARCAMRPSSTPERRCRSLLFHIHFSFTVAALPHTHTHTTGDTAAFSALPLAASSHASFCSLPTILPYFSYEFRNGLMDRRMRVPVLLTAGGRGGRTASAWDEIKFNVHLWIESRLSNVRFHGFSSGNIQMCKHMEPCVLHCIIVTYLGCIRDNWKMFI